MIRIGIFGYGNLGKGVELAVNKNSDMVLKGIFTRRDPSGIKTLTGCPVFAEEKLPAMKDEIDVLILCGGSATDLPVQTPRYAALFNCVDSFDTHANIPVHFENVDRVARENGTTCLISAGWDPGMFSLNRLYASCILPDGKDYTFWGKGVSQGHSDAVRRIKGVKDCRQYTIPVPSSLEAVRKGEQPELSVRQKHTRECFVVAEEGADPAAIEQEIKTMPHYFDEYDTTIHFITAEEMQRDHAELPHGGNVIRTGFTGLNNEHKHIVEYSIALDSNPEFTGSVIAAFARAVNRMHAEGQIGCKTVLDVAPAYLSPKSNAELLAHCV